MKPQHQRILEALQKGVPLQGKDRDAVIRWCEPRARRQMAKAERKARVRVNPVLAAADRQRSDHSAILRKADDNFSILIRWLGTRDYDGVRMGRCCTCTKILPFKELQCGHWILRGKWGTRYDFKNSAPQCPPCNARHIGNGRVERHEAYIEKRHGAGTANKLRVQAKLRTRKPTDMELAAWANHFMEEAVLRGYSPEAVA